MTAPEGLDFIGAKAALFCGGRLLTLQRDDLPGLPWPGMWDLPGGGREGDESAENCLVRELYEEFSLTLPPERLVFRGTWPSAKGGPLPGVFFAGQITETEVQSIRFGDEGQGWALMPVAEYLSHPLAIPAMVARVLSVERLDWRR